MEPLVFHLKQLSLLLLSYSLHNEHIYPIHTVQECSCCVALPYLLVVPAELFICGIIAKSL